jgi:nitrate reductase NapE component
MLVICEDCAKKYNIDESRIKGRRARFTCNKCGHIIIVDKDDMARRLISGKLSANAVAGFDINMQGSLPQMEGSQAAADVPRPAGRRKKKGWPVFFYFITAMVFALISVSLVTGYLYSQYLVVGYMAEAYSQPVEQRSSIMVKSTLMFAGAWSVIMAVMLVIAGTVHRKFEHLIRNANQLAAGQYDISFVKNGPREVRDLAFALEKIRAHLKSII